MTDNKEMNINPSDKQPTYEQAMARLADIVRTLDGGKLSLDESVKLFEEGAKLADFCDKCLKNAELRITRLGEEPEKTEEN